MKTFLEYIAEREETESVVSERNTMGQITEVTDKEINALRQLAKDVEKIKKDYLKIVNMGDGELKDKKYNNEFEDILSMQKSIQSLIQKLKDKKILNRESVVNEELTGNEPPYQLELAWKTRKEKIGSFVVDDKTYDRLRHWFWDDFIFNVVGWKAKGRLSSFDDVVKVAMNTKTGKIPAVRKDTFGLLQK